MWSGGMEEQSRQEVFFASCLKGLSMFHKSLSQINWQEVITPRAYRNILISLTGNKNIPVERSLYISTGTKVIITIVIILPIEPTTPPKRRGPDLSVS